MGQGLKGESLDPINTRRFQRLCQSSIWNAVVAYERYLAIGREDSAIAAAGQVKSSIGAYIGFRDCWEVEAKGISTVNFKKNYSIDKLTCPCQLAQ